MKCKNCGGEVLENQQFCTNCGVKVDNQNTNTSELSANSNSLKEEVNENIPSLNPENEVQVNNDVNTLDNNQSDIKENNQVNILKMDENTMVNNNLSNECCFTFDIVFCICICDYLCCFNCLLFLRFIFSFLFFS